MANLSLKTTSSTIRCIITLSGEIWGGDQSHHLYEETSRLLDENFKEIVIDLKDVVFINSSGIAMLVRLHVKAEQKQVQLTIACANDNLKKTFDFMALDKVMHIVDSYRP
jgi:anti-sigma B factor antagonist